MLRQATNRVKIEGILSEIDLKYGSFTKNGKAVESIGGSIKVKVDQVVNGEEQHLEIPVYMFATKFTNDGRSNPAYNSIEKVMTEYTSIAAAGGEAQADRIRITRGDIQMNEYLGRNGQIVSFPRIHTSFVSRATGEFKPEASFTLEFSVNSIAPETDKNGIELDPPRVKVMAAVPQYRGKIEMVPLVATNPNVINAISHYWLPGNSYEANGRLYFSSKTETVVEEVDFGEPTERIRTTSVSDLVITGGRQNPLEGDFAFDPQEVKAAMVERQERLNNLKTSNTSKKAPVPMDQTTRSYEASKDEIGF